MTSINTNAAAMLALDTLRGINKDLSTVNDQISTGKKINTAKDNASIWSIAKTMESDIMSFKTITESLSLASSTVGVARNAAESVTDLLVEVKSLVTQAQNKSTADRAKIQTDINNLSTQIQDIVEAAQFNGVNLLNNTDNNDFLSSFNRAGSGVTTDSIRVTGIDLQVGSYGEVTDGTLGTAALAGYTAGGAIDNSGGSVTTTDNVVANLTAAQTIKVGDVFELDVTGSDPITYTAQAGDDAESVLEALAGQLNSTNLPAGVTLSSDAVVNNAGTWELRVDVAAGTASFTAAVDSGASTLVGDFAGGDLGALLNLSVASETAGETALTTIETLITTATNASASFGSAQKRIDIQSEFITSLTGSLELGNSALTDADLSEASSRLQSLQVKQQLGLQSLSIANQAPQSILALFR